MKRVVAAAVGILLTVGIMTGYVPAGFVSIESDRPDSDGHYHVTVLTVTEGVSSSYVDERELREVYEKSY